MRRGRKRRGSTDPVPAVWLSSHLLSEVDQVCDHVGVMSRGRFVAQDSLVAMRAATLPLLTVTTPDAELAVNVLGALGLSEVRVENACVTARQGEVAAERIVKVLVDAGVRVHGFQVATPSLEDLFVGLTGEGFDVGG